MSSARFFRWLGARRSESGLARRSRPAPSALMALILPASLGAVVWLGELGCAPRRATMARGIELEPPSSGAHSAADAGAAAPDSPLIASGGGQAPASAEHDDSSFVFSREPLAERARAVAQFPIHIHETWWPFRARHLGITEAEAKKRDSRITDAHAPEGFWDSQTAVEAVSLWTVLCNECHGGRRSLADAAEMPEPAAAWGETSGLFFGNRRSYRQLFNTVHDGGPLKANGRVGMPAWRNILSNEMIWALLYFLEYQSGGIESRFPPSLYPRRPKLLGEP